MKHATTSNATTAPTAPELEKTDATHPRPGLLLIWEPRGAIADDRVALKDGLVVGRSKSCSWCIVDRMLSRQHFRIDQRTNHDYILRDLGSHNGVSVDGAPVIDEAELHPGSLIRAGGCLFYAAADLNELATPDQRPQTLFAGRFQSAGLDRALRIASKTGLHLLLEGETGVGKELAAQRFAELERAQGRTADFVIHNAACFAGDDDAVGTLFGVVKGAYSGVDRRRGALEAADGGTLFLDEAHALTLRVQRSLLRFIEDGEVRSLGQEISTRSSKRLDVRLILGTNIPIDEAVASGQLAHDLVARLRIVRIPPLRQRVADIPSIFLALLDRTLEPEMAEELNGVLRAKHLERMCLHDYRRGNVRELVHLAKIAAARIDEGTPAEDALEETLDEIFGPPSLPRIQNSQNWNAGKAAHREAVSQSTYEENKATILAAYEEVGGNLSRMVNRLGEQGIDCSRRWLAIYLDRWGLRPIPKRRR